MKEGLFQSIFTAFILMLMVLMQVILPIISRKNLFLGIRIPDEQIGSNEIKKIKHNYILSSLVIGIIYAIFFTFLVYSLDENMFALVLVGSIFGSILVMFLVYYKFNRQTAALKKEKNWMQDKKQVVAIDTKFSLDKNSNYIISSWWFLVPIAFIVVTIIVNALIYPNIPDRVPMHWDLSGHVTNYAVKSKYLIFQMPSIELFLTGIMFLSNKIIAWSKQQIDARDPEKSKQQNIIFRRKWSQYLLFSNMLFIILMSVGDLQIMNVIKTNGTLMMFVTFGVIGIITVYSIYLSVKMGQGGSNIKLDSKNENANVTDRDDDKFWVLGNTIYYNPDDPALMIEKRVGVGWTINAGRPAGMAIYIIIAVIIIACLAGTFFAALMK